MYCVFLSLDVILILANNGDPGEMQLYAAFHMGLHWLPKYPIRGSSMQMVEIYKPGVLFMGKNQLRLNRTWHLIIY